MHPGLRTLRSITDDATQRRRLRNRSEAEAPAANQLGSRRARSCGISPQILAEMRVEWSATAEYSWVQTSREPMGIEVTKCTRTLRLKVKSEAYGWLNAAAIEVNQVWNYANATSDKAARPFSGPGKWLSAYDLDKLTAGATECFERIGSETIQRVNAEYATRRRQFKKTKLRWRVSRGSRRSLGWVPFKAVQLKRKGKSLRLSGKAFRIFERDRLEGVRWKSGCFAQDAVGDWWLCVAVDVLVTQVEARSEAVGLDLGLKTVVTTSDGEKLEAGRFYRNIELKIALAQRRGHKRQAKRLHRTAARRRKDALHQFSRRMVDQYQTIVVGDVSAPQACQDADGQIRAGLRLGNAQSAVAVQGPAGRQVRSNRQRKNTTRACSSCGALTGPTGLDMLVVRTWMCSGCGDTHDRDVNAARNILSAGRCPPSVCGNERSSSAAPTSQAHCRCESRTSALKKAA